ncbi:MAG: hypothetical protein U0169_24805 [Polyangiaceae bacterium]
MDTLWHVGIVRAGVAAFADATFVPEVRWLPDAPFDAYLADPILHTTGDGHVLVCERYDYATRRGSIVLAPFDDGAVGSFRTIHAPGHHVSFPSLFASEGVTYATFEESARRRVVLHRWAGMDLPFEPVATLLEGVRAVDPFVFFHGGIHWLFVTDDEDVLRIFHADRVLGPYLPHRKNPFPRSPFGERSAGRPFARDGRTFRPVQVGHPRYGAATEIREIFHLSPDAFDERPVRRIDPVPGRFGLGLHTVNGHGTWSVVDGLRRSRMPPVIRAVAGSVGARLAARSTSRRSSPW